MYLLEPYQVYILLGCLIVFILYTVFLLFKHEQKQWYKIFWLVLILCLPILGSLFYFLKYKIETYKLAQSM